MSVLSGLFGWVGMTWRTHADPSQCSGRAVSPTTCTDPTEVQAVASPHETAVSESPGSGPGLTWRW